MTLIKDLLDLHRSGEIDLERGASFDLLSEKTGFSLSEIETAVAELRDAGLCYRDPDASAPGGVARRLRATAHFLRKFGIG